MVDDSGGVLPLGVIGQGLHVLADHGDELIALGVGHHGVVHCDAHLPVLDRLATNDLLDCTASQTIGSDQRRALAA
ncbi:hypothetical protein D3C78_1675060 [compost metagenome]